MRTIIADINETIDRSSDACSLKLRSLSSAEDVTMANQKFMRNDKNITSDHWGLRRVFEESVRAMGQMVEVRDPYTAGHQSRVSQICVDIAVLMGLPVFQIKGLELAALVHDVGKLAIPSEILNKPGQLSRFEFDLIKTHPMVGYDIMKSIEFPWPIAKTVLQHHERIDGSGYPAGLIKKDILLEARILGVVDVIEAISSHRPYRASKGIESALEEICLNKGRLYDGDVVDASLEYYAISGHGV